MPRPFLAVAGRNKKLRLAVAYVVNNADFEGLESCSPSAPMVGDFWTFPALGIPELRVHPLHLVSDDDLQIVALWQEWTGGGHFPDAGGLNDQSSWLVDAFRICNAAAHALKPKDR